jgi:hypothetical protein
MRGPKVTCSHCGKVRDPMQHMRAEHPPTAAKAWLRKHCPVKGAGPSPCSFGYQAGVDVEGLQRVLAEKAKQ